MKTCKACKEDLPAVHFWKRKENKDGLATNCIPCTKELRKPWDWRYVRTEKRLAERAAYKRKRRAAGLVHESDRRNAAIQRARHPLRMRAYALVRAALASGRLAGPETCSGCGRRPPRAADGRTAVHAHHHKGYDRPLDVLWICQTCHSLDHRNRARGEKGGG
jgi:hypothetical protein